MTANMHRSYELSEKVVFITGAAAGIGAAAARLFAEEGARLALCDRDARSLDRLMAELTGGELKVPTDRVFAVPADISDAAAVTAAVSSAMQAFGRLDGAFNNAGIAGPSGGVLSVEEADWRRTLDINLTGVWHCVRAQLDVMQQGAAIVNTSSLAGLIGSAQAAAYSASKHAIIGLTRSVALEYGTRGIRVNAIAPGPTRTPLLEKIFATVPGSEERMVSRTALKRTAEPREIAQAALWLLSDRSSYITGHVLPVDGGQMAA